MGYFDKQNYINILKNLFINSIIIFCFYLYKIFWVFLKMLNFKIFIFEDILSEGGIYDKEFVEVKEFNGYTYITISVWFDFIKENNERRIKFWNTNTGNFLHEQKKLTFFILVADSYFKKKYLSEYSPKVLPIEHMRLKGSEVEITNYEFKKGEVEDGFELFHEYFSHKDLLIGLTKCYQGATLRRAIPALKLKNSFMDVNIYCYE